MSLLGELKPKKGSTHRAKLLGRGRGSGKGGTSGKGHKGQKARKGGSIRRGFEGGQTPLWRRTPKVGFSNVMFANNYDAVNISMLDRFDGEVNPETLKAAGLVKNNKVKILAKGQISKALTVKAHKFSEAAKAAIEKAGGTAETLPNT